MLTYKQIVNICNNTNTNNNNTFKTFMDIDNALIEILNKEGNLKVTEEIATKFKTLLIAMKNLNKVLGLFDNEKLLSYQYFLRHPLLTRYDKDDTKNKYKTPRQRLNKIVNLANIPLKLVNRYHLENANIKGCLCSVMERETIEVFNI